MASDRMSPRSESPETLAAASALEQAWALLLTAPERAAAIVDAWSGAAGSRPSFHSLFAEIILAAALGRHGDRDAAREGLGRVEQDLARTSLAESDRVRLFALCQGVRGMLHTIERELSAAIRELDDALAAGPVLPALDRHYLHVWRAVAQMASAKPELAFRDFFAEYEYVRTHHPAVFALLALNIGAVVLHAGDWEGSESSLRHALESEHLVEVRGYGVVCRVNLAYCWIQTGRIEKARALMAELVSGSREYLLQQHAGDVLAIIAEDLIETGFLDEAEQYLRGLMADASRRGFRLGLATGSLCEGRLAWVRGNRAAAVQKWRSALLLLRRLPHMLQFWKTLQSISEAYAQRGDYRRAWRWHRRYHAAHTRWSATSQPARLAYAREALELRLTREQAIRDPVTGLLNRRELVSRLDKLIADSIASGEPLAIGMIDIDSLKPINDRYGHLTGDNAIMFAAERLRMSMPGEALLFRYGGDEYCALLPNCTRERATTLFANYLDALRAWRNPATTERRATLTASIGIAMLGVTDLRPDSLLDAADTALYRAKRSGGNRIA